MSIDAIMSTSAVSALRHALDKKFANFDLRKQNKDVSSVTFLVDVPASVDQCISVSVDQCISVSVYQLIKRFKLVLLLVSWLCAIVWAIIEDNRTRSGP